MKQRVGNAHEDQSVRCLWEERVGRIEFRGGLNCHSKTVELH